MINNLLSRTIICQYLLTVGMVFFVFALLFFIFTKAWAVILVFLFIALLQFICLITVLTYDWAKIEQSKNSLVQMYLYQIMIALLGLAVLFWHEGNMAMSLYFFVVPVGALTLMDSRKSVFFALLSGLFFGAIFLIEYFLPDVHYIIITPQLNLALNIFILSSIFLFLFFFLFWHNKIVLQQQQDLIVSELAIADKEILPPPTIAEQKNFDDLHKRILACFEETKPYLDPDFSIIELAKMLESNTTYVYRTLKTKENCNFNTFVNIYRINWIKQRLDAGEEQQYTMAHIYTSAGFRHQSTFNQAFKNITGMTPSDYIKQKK